MKLGTSPSGVRLEHVKQPADKMNGDMVMGSFSWNQSRNGMMNEGANNMHAWSNSEQRIKTVTNPSDRLRDEDHHMYSPKGPPHFVEETYSMAFQENQPSDVWSFARRQ